MENLNDIEKLNELKEKGIISDAEFQEQKTKILNGPVSGGKSQLAYVLLAFFLGGLGIHNFYAGRWKRGLAQLLLTFTIIGAFITYLWAVINIFAIHTDGQGKEFDPCPVAKYICGILGIIWYLWSVIGVLSIAGIAGYSLGMRKYRANETLQYVSMVSVMAASANGAQGLSEPVRCQQLAAEAGTTVPEFLESTKCVAYPNGRVVLSGVDSELSSDLLRSGMQMDSNGNLYLQF